MTTDTLSNWLKLVTLMIGVVGGVVALIRGAYEISENTRQHRADLRWKQANAAKELLSDIHHDQRAAAAVLMMDWSDRPRNYDIGSGQQTSLSYKDVLAALAKKTDEDSDQKETYIRDSFDWFFYYLDRIEHYIETGLIEYVDVASVFRPYVRKIRKNNDVYGQFIASHEYELVPQFISRFGASR